MSHSVSQALRSPASPVDSRPWYRQVNATQWRAFLASFLGWTLAGFDFTIISFLVVDIQQSFTISKALAGALATVTLMFRLLGGAAAGSAADRWGGKGPLGVFIPWYLAFAVLRGF